MLRQLAVTLAYASILCSATAESSLLSQLSPDLQKFMDAHPAALTVLSNEFSESFSNRSVGIFYFYSTNETVARAAHFYPDVAGVRDVFIVVQENQHPLDQFITLLFETLNSRGERQFKNLFEDAYNGSISKDVFVKTISRLEFAQLVNTRALLVPLHFSKKEIKQSYYYKLVMDCPLDFQGFLAYSKSSPSKRDVDKYYEDQYDELRKKNTAKSEAPKSEPEHHPTENSENSTPKPRAQP